MTKVLFLGTFTVFLIVLANGHFKLIHRFQEWRYGRKVDQTHDWAAFNKAFEADK